MGIWPRLALLHCAIILDHAGDHNDRTGRPTQGTWTWRSCDGALLRKPQYG